MKVRDLIKLLEQRDPDADVYTYYRNRVSYIGDENEVVAAPHPTPDGTKTTNMRPIVIIYTENDNPDE